MDEAFQREVDALQSSQQLHRQHGDSNGTDRQGNPQEDQAVGHGGGQQHGEGQQAENGACDLPEEHGAGDQRSAEPDQKGDHKRDRRGEDAQDDFHGAGVLSFVLSSLYRPCGIAQGYGKSGATANEESCRPAPYLIAASLERITSAVSTSLSYSIRRPSMSAS